QINSIIIGLIIINVVVFFITQFFQFPVPGGLVSSLIEKGKNTLAFAIQRYGLFITIFSLFPEMIKNGWVWQVVTYMFLHGSLLHLFFNMYALFLFGRPLEEKWGTREFIYFYFASGIGAGIVTFIWNSITNPFIPTIGASGAVFGVMLAFGLEFPNAMLLLFFIIPVRAKYAALIFGGIELVMLATGSMRGIGHFTHLAGLFFGYMYYVMRIKNRYRSGRRGGPGITRRLKRGVSNKIRDISEQKKKRDIYPASVIRSRIRKDLPLDRKQREFLSKLEQSYQESGSELCEPDEFEINSRTCLDCDAFYACLYRFLMS
ncbi:MAG: rhomboid family intramembrane serine protease, partial [Spirochaetota bacterium]